MEVKNIKVIDGYWQTMFKGVALCIEEYEDEEFYYVLRDENANFVTDFLFDDFELIGSTDYIDVLRNK